MDFLGRSCSSQEPNHLHGVMSFLLLLLLFLFLFFLTSSSTMVVCFPIPVFGLLFVSSHVSLYLIIVLLFLCQQFIRLPRHLIMCCVNSLLSRLHSLWMMVLSGLLTCVDVCSFIGITAQVNTLHLGVWGPFSGGRAPLVSPSVPLPSPLSPFLALFCSLFVHLSLIHKITSPPLFYTPHARLSVSPSFLCS